MSRSWLLALPLLLAAPLAATAGIIQTVYPPEVAPSLVVAGALPSDPIYSAAPGTGFDGVGALLLRTTTTPAGLVTLCSGSVLTGGIDVLTAAHCVTDGAGTLDLISGSVFFSTTTGGTEVIPIQGAAFHPSWTGDLLAGYDLALIRLARPVSASVPTYAIYEGSDELSSAYTVSGFGRSGTGATGSTLEAGTRRKGRNEFEMTLAMMGFGSAAVLVSDFDGPSPATDGFGYFFNLAGPGLGLEEVSIAPGDSGGPAFLGGRIAGVSSFGMRLVGAGGTTSDVDGVLNSSFGEFNAFTRVSSYRDWIASPHDFTLIPEPASGLLLLAGLAAFAALRRRL